MEYKVTFEDGSEALAHYGVLGMKWGKWNAETAAKYAHRGNRGARAYEKGDKLTAKFEKTGNEKYRQKASQQYAKGDKATQEHQERIGKAVENLDREARAAVASGKARTMGLNRATGRYINATNDPTWQRMQSRTLKSVVVGGWPMVILQAITPKGRQIRDDYSDRVMEIMDKAVSKASAERDTGKQWVDARFEEMTRKGRKDVY